MAERVFHRADVADVEAFADDHQAAARFFQFVVHVVGQLRQRTGAFGQINLQRHLALGIGQPGGGGNVADFPPHRLHHQHRIGRRTAGVFLVGVLHHVHPVFRRAAVAGRVVDQFEFAVAHVVVDRFRHADGDQIEPALAGQLGDLVGRVHRIVAADVEKIANVVGLEHVDRAVEILGLRRLELVAAGADRAGRRRVPQAAILLPTDWAERSSSSSFSTPSMPCRAPYTVPISDNSRAVSIMPRRQLLMTGLGPPLWATTMLRRLGIRFGLQFECSKQKCRDGWMETERSTSRGRQNPPILERNRTF